MARVLLGILVFDSFSLLQGWKLMFLLNEFAETKSQLLVNKTQRKVDDFSWEKKWLLKQHYTLRKQSCSCRLGRQVETTSNALSSITIGQYSWIDIWFLKCIQGKGNRRFVLCCWYWWSESQLVQSVHLRQSVLSFLQYFKTSIQKRLLAFTWHLHVIWLMHQSVVTKMAKSTICLTSDSWKSGRSCCNYIPG